MERVISGGVDAETLLGSEVGGLRRGRTDEAQTNGLARWLNFTAEVRAAFRLSRTGLHLVWGMATVAFAFPFLSLTMRRALKARWSNQLLVILGVRLHVEAKLASGGLIVANHISWLDIYVINASVPTAFISKADVRGWPLIGWLSAHNETIFMERDSRRAAMRAKDRVTGELMKGGCVTLFPEGTTSDGSTVAPFHTALFQSAIEADSDIFPVAVYYTDGRRGKRSSVPIYVGDTSLWQSLKAVVAADRLTANLIFLPKITTSGADIGAQRRLRRVGLCVRSSEPVAESPKQSCPVRLNASAAGSRHLVVRPRWCNDLSIWNSIISAAAANDNGLLRMIQRSVPRYRRQTCLPFGCPVIAA
jgi:1-acyl-sn-glycerol-3-phosphate acyltransferase